jgi:hypothetical protein
VSNITFKFSIEQRCAHPVKYSSKRYLLTEVFVFVPSPPKHRTFRLSFFTPSSTESRRLHRDLLVISCTNLVVMYRKVGGYIWYTIVYYTIT